MNKSPDYLILDNPLINGKDGQQINSVSYYPPVTESYKNSLIQPTFIKVYDKKISSTSGEILNNTKNELGNISMYIPLLNKINNNIIKPSVALRKFVEKKNRKR